MRAPGQSRRQGRPMKPFRRALYAWRSAREAAPVERGGQGANLQGQCRPWSIFAAVRKRRLRSDFSVLGEFRVS
jgi:hypothetical protein